MLVHEIISMSRPAGIGREHAMPELKRKLTLFDLSMISIGATIGSGIFLTPSLVAKALPSPLWIIGIWLVGGLWSLCGALTYAELGSMMPGAGGLYVYLSKAYGDLFGFLYGWIYFSVVNTGSLAALAIAFASYLGYFIPLSPMATSLVGIAGLVLLTVINVLGVKAGAIFSDLFTVLKILGIFVLIVIGLGWGSSETSDFSAGLGSLPGGLGSALAMGMLGVMWSYGGWHHCTFVAGEAKKPRRDIPLAMLIGAVVVSLVYALTNLAYMFLLSPTQMAGSERVASDAMAVVLGGVGGGFIAIVIFISTFGTSGIYSLAAPRIYFAMAGDGTFFKKVAEIHPKYKTPSFAIIFQCIWACILILFWGTFENLISYVVFADSIFFALTAAAIYLFRKRQPNAERKYKTPGYPVTPMIFIGLNVWFIAYTLINKPLESFAGLGFVLLGIPIYYYWKAKSRKAGTQ